MLSKTDSPENPDRGGEDIRNPPASLQRLCLELESAFLSFLCPGWVFFGGGCTLSKNYRKHTHPKLHLYVINIITRVELLESQQSERYESRGRRASHAAWAHVGALPI